MLKGVTTRRAALGTLIGATLLIRASTGLANPQVTPQDHGAVGDGRTDDWRAFQDALAAAAGGTLYVMPGRYLLSRGLVVPPNTSILADGATLTWTAQVKALALGAGATITGGAIVGPGGQRYGADGYGISCYGRRDRDGAGPPDYIAGPTIRGTTIRGWGYAGVYLGYLQRASIQDCSITDIGYCGIGGVSIEDVLIERNVIDGVGGAGAPNSYGIFADRLEDSEVRHPRSRRVRIANNTVRNVTAWEAIDTHGGEDFEIVNNTISGCRFGIAVVGSEIHGKNVLAARRVTVAYNTIEGSDDGAAIIIAGAVTGSRVNQLAEDCRVFGNTITKGGRFSDTAEGAIRVYATRGLLIESNTLDQPRLMGINLIVENHDIVVTRNQIKDVCDTVRPDPSGIAVTGHNNTGSIESNVLLFENARASTHVAALAIGISPSLNGLSLNIGGNAVRTGDRSKLRLNFGTTRGVSYSNQ